MMTASDSLYFYRANQLVTVKRGNDNRIIFRTSDAPLAERQYDQPTAGLLAVEDKGTVVRAQREGRYETHDYLPYGYDASLPSALTVLGFNGEALIAQHLGYALGQGYRFFSPASMRFNAPDHLSPFAEGGLNAYSYCKGDPINYVDPSGRMRRVAMRNGQVMRVSKNAVVEIEPRPAASIPPPAPAKSTRRNSWSLSMPPTATERGLSATGSGSDMARPGQLGGGFSQSKSKPFETTASAAPTPSAISDSPHSSHVSRLDASRAVSRLSSAGSSQDSTPATSRSPSPTGRQLVDPHHVRAALDVRQSRYYSHNADPAEYVDRLRP